MGKNCGTVVLQGYLPLPILSCFRNSVLYRKKNASIKLVAPPSFLSLIHCHRSIEALDLPRQTMATTVREVLPKPLDAIAEPPSLFDGTTRLYLAYTCPFAQRAWITRNYKGLQEKIKLVPLDLQNRPAWFKEKLYPENKVPCLEHNGKVVGESLDLIKYINSNFEGPSLFPDDPAKRQFAEELLSYIDTFTRNVYMSFKGDTAKEAGPPFDYLENALDKFNDGPFLLGQFSLVDIAYIPFIERFQVFLLDVLKFDFTEGRPKLAKWFEEINKIDAYKQTKANPQEIVELYKRFLAL